jgi:hypothetical protein
VEGSILISPPLALPETVGLARRANAIVTGTLVRSLLGNKQYRRWFFARYRRLVIAAVTAKLAARRGSPGPVVEARSDGLQATNGLLVEDELAGLLFSGRFVDVLYGVEDANYQVLTTDGEANRAIERLLLSDVRLGWNVVEGAIHGLEDIDVQRRIIEFVTTTVSARTQPVAA